METIENRKKIKDYQFHNFAWGGILFLPKCKSIGESAFQDAKFRNAINLPKCRFIDRYAFYNSEFQCVYNLQKCERIGDHAFFSSECTGELNIPNCTFIGESAFYNSSFNKITIAENVVLEDNCFGKNTEKFIESYKINNRRAGSYLFTGERWFYAYKHN